MQRQLNWRRPDDLREPDDRNDDATRQKVVYYSPYLDPSPFTCLLSLLMPVFMVAMGTFARTVATHIVTMT